MRSELEVRQIYFRELPKFLILFRAENQVTPKMWSQRTPTKVLFVLSSVGRVLRQNLHCMLAWSRKGWVPQKLKDRLTIRRVQFIRTDLPRVKIRTTLSRLTRILSRTNQAQPRRLWAVVTYLELPIQIAQMFSNPHQLIQQLRASKTWFRSVSSNNCSMFSKRIRNQIIWGSKIRLQLPTTLLQEEVTSSRIG